MSKMWNNVVRLKRHLKTTKQEQSGVSDHVIRVPGPEDHYSNPPTMSSIPISLDLIRPLALKLIHPRTRALPSVR